MPAVTPVSVPVSGPVAVKMAVGVGSFSGTKAVMVISCWGYAPEDMEIIFEPVMTTSPAERAELVQKMSSDVIEAFRAGLLSREEALAELKSRGERLGVYTKV